MTVSQVTNCLGIVNSGGDHTTTFVPVRIVLKGPAVHGTFCGETLQSTLPRFGIPNGRKAGRSIAACPPALGSIFEPSVKDISAPGYAKADGVRSSPLIQSF